MTTKAIIFDIDGVLADSREAVVHNTIEVLTEFGFAALRKKVEGMSSAHSAESVLIALVPMLAGDQKLLKKMLLSLSKATVKNIGLVKPAKIAGIVPGLSRKYALAAASNRKTSAMLVLEKLGLSEYFKVVVTSSDAPPKPDPKMILIALEKLGVKAEEAIFFGDNLEDLQAGRAAGVRTVMVNCEEEGAVEKILLEIARR